MVQVILWVLIPTALVIPVALIAFVLVMMTSNAVTNKGQLAFDLFLFGKIMIGSGFWVAGRFNDIRLRIVNALEYPPVLVQGPATPEHLAEVAGSRPLFLYLRAFRGDGSVHTQPASPQRSALNYTEVFAPVKTYEMLLASLYRSNGELLAIGSPGEMLPPAGFRRVYVSEEYWREWLDSFLAVAVQVIIEVGRSRNLQWEEERVLQAVPSERITFFLHDRTTPDAMAITIALLRSSRPTFRSSPKFLYIDQKGSPHTDRDLDTAVRRVFRMSVPDLLERAARIHQCSRCDCIITAGTHAEYHGKMLCSACYYYATLDQKNKN